MPETSRVNSAQWLCDRMAELDVSKKTLKEALSIQWKTLRTWRTDPLANPTLSARQWSAFAEHLKVEPRELMAVFDRSGTELRLPASSWVQFSKRLDVSLVKILQRFPK